MNNQTILLKIKERINKLDSQDYDNIQSWQLLEAFNKASVEWVRRQLQGTNQSRQGDEDSKRRIDDLNVLLTTLPLTLTHYKLYDQSTQLPIYPSSNAYLEFKRLELYAKRDCCEKEKLITVYLGEEANVTWYLDDSNKQPNFDWGETFMTFYNSRVRIYTNSDFTISKANLIYYKQPPYIQILGVVDPYSGNLPSKEVTSIFKDDIVEVIIDDAAAILSGDIENWQMLQREQSAAERNN